MVAEEEVNGREGGRLGRCDLGMPARGAMCVTGHLQYLQMLARL